jgi:predicted hydrocarbon binding protein
MTPVNSRPSELALPVAALAAIRKELATAVGADTAARALQSAGNAAGDAFFRALAHGFGNVAGSPDPEQAAREKLGAVDQAAFWRRFSELFAQRGWGHLSLQPVHPGVAALDAADWVEADPDAGAGRPGCFFTTGLLASVLGRVAGEDVAVLEVACRSRGDDRCRFLFGAPDTLDALFRAIQDGRDLEASLAAIA